MLDSVAGTEFSASAGEEIEVDAKVAKSWLEAGLAEPVAKRAAKSAEKRVTTDVESR
jgi:hypothetical protein